MVNNLGFEGQEAKWRGYYVGTYITREKKIHNVFIDEIQTVIIEYNFLQYTPTNERKGVPF